MAQKTLDLLDHGIHANHSDVYRHKNLILLPPEGSLVISGDLHGHARNFERIVSFADLDNHPDRHVVLQEIIHGGPQTSDGGCLSYHVLFDAIQYKVKFPNQVHIIMGNHDTALITRSEVMKDGREMNQAMLRAIKKEFPQSWEDVEQKYI